MKLLGLQDFIDLSSAFFPRASRRAERLLRRVGTRLSPVEAPFSTTLRSLQLYATDPAALDRPRRVRIQGLEHLEAALARGKGVILWENPFGNSLLGKLALLQHGFSLVQVHGPEHGASQSWLGQTVIKRLHRRISSRIFEEVIDIDYRSLAYLRRIAERLKANRIVCLRAFGRAGKKFVLTRFNGETLYFPTGIMTLARQADAVLMAIFCFPDGEGDQLVLSAPLPPERGDEGLVRLAARYLGELHSFVERYPKLWWGCPEPPPRTDRLKILQAKPEVELRPAAASEVAAPKVAWWRKRRPAPSPCFLTVDAETKVIPEGVRTLSAIRDEVQHEVGMPMPITWFMRFQRRWDDYTHRVLPPVEDSAGAFFDGFELLRPLVSELLSRGDEIGWHYHAYHYVLHRDLPHSARIAVLESDLACCAGAMRSRHPELRIEAFRFGWFFAPDHSLYRTLAALGLTVDASARPNCDGKEVQNFGIPHTPAIVREPAVVHGILCVPYRSTWVWHDWSLVPHDFTWHRMSPQEATAAQEEFRHRLRRIADSARTKGGGLATYTAFRRSREWNPR